MVVVVVVFGVVLKDGNSKGEGRSSGAAGVVALSLLAVVVVVVVTYGLENCE